MASILHLSDLHRSPAEPLGNSELLSMLLADMDRWPREDPKIPLPSAIVVSGDIVRGARLGDVTSDATLAGQYGDALDFISRLTDEVVAGDRSQVVLVPGNHDVDWNCARRAMVPVPDKDLPPDLKPSTFGPLGDLRWNWKERRAYKIVDQELYLQRFAAFARFHDEFYQGSRILQVDDYYATYSLLKDRIGVAAFNSNYGNDCFATHGHIPHETISRAHLELRSRGHDLLMGVWHHNVDGAPYASDYMDVDVVYQLIGKDFRLGVHGHQHRAQVGQRYIHLAEYTPMALVSAGSLCAGWQELPTGVNRQYNVLEFDEELTELRVHVREIAGSMTFGPARRAELSEHSYVDFSLGKPQTTPSETLAVRQDEKVILAEAHRRAGRFKDALAALEELPRSTGSYQQALLIDTIRSGRLWEDAVRVIFEPTTAEELVLLAEARYQLGSPADAAAVVARFSANVDLPTQQRSELIARYKALGMLKR